MWPKDFGLATTGKSAEHDPGVVAAPGIQYPAAVGLVAALPALHRMSRGLQEPGDGLRTHAAAPAVDLQRAFRRVLVRLRHKVGHFGSDQGEAQANSFRLALFLVANTHLGPLVVAEKGHG